MFSRSPRGYTKIMKSIAILLVLSTVCAEMPGIWLGDPVIDTKIIKGEDANDGEFPYMASLREKPNKHVCGGSILTSNWVLTAAACCSIGNDTHFINAGSTRLNQGGSNHSIDKFIIHRDYDPNFYWINDICLVRVLQHFKYGNNVGQITLPPYNWMINSGDKLTVTGWGFTTSKLPQQLPNKLQKATAFTALSDEQCRNETGVPVTPAHFCARGGVKGQGICNGDSGSPIVRNGVQVGISSWMFFPCGSGRPDFFCRVSFYINWIKRELGGEADKLQFAK